MAKADVKSFQAVEAFRVALVKFAESTMLALENAEAEGQRVLTWLETEQRSYWKAARRQASEDLTRAKDAYRQKALFKDASGARHSATEELQMIRRCEARLDECERKAAATRRHAVALKNELQTFRGATGRLRNMLSGEVPVAVAELADAVASLERYAAARPDSEAAGDSRPAMTRAAIEPDETETGVADAELRSRTPAAASRARAGPGTAAKFWPDVPSTAREAAAPRLSDDKPGKYDLITVALPAETPPEQWHVYLERGEPFGPNDTGWHVGWAGERPCEARPTTMTAGRLATVAPHLAELLRLPVGTLAVARGNTICRLVDTLGRAWWRGDEAGGDT